MPVSPNIYMYLTSLLTVSHFFGHFYCVKFKSVKLIELVPSYRQQACNFSLRVLEFYLVLKM